MRRRLLDRAEARLCGASGHVHIAQIGKFNVHRALCRPTAFLVEVGESQLVNPNLGRFLATVVVLGENIVFLQRVANANHQRFDNGNVRVAHHGYLALGAAAARCHHVGHRLRNRRVARFYLGVALKFGIDQLAENHFHIVLFGPNKAAVVVVVGVGPRRPPRRHLQRHLVLVVVLGVVLANADKASHLIVGQRRLVVNRLGVYEHLDFLIVTHIDVHRFIDGLRVAVAQTGHLHRHTLLVEFDKLRLRRVLLARNAHRQKVVDGCAAAVFLNVHGRYAEGCRRFVVVLVVRQKALVAGLQVVVVGEPIALHKVESGETQNHFLLPSVKEHTHKANRRKVFDITNLLTRPRVERNAEQVPFHRFALAVGHCVGHVALIDNVVRPDKHIVVVQIDPVLEVRLALAQGVIAVNILNIRLRRGVG